MKKYIIIAAVFTACLALCAAVWPLTGAVEETARPNPDNHCESPEAAR